MKKSILLALIAVGLTVSFFVGISVSQERRAAIESQKAYEIQIQLAQQDVRAVQKVYVFEENVFGSEELSANSKTQRLRNEVLQLIQQHLQKMNDEELTAELARIQKELGEHEAEAKLQKARNLRQHADNLLQEILKTYPKSEAAKQARKMLGFGPPLNIEIK